MKKAKALSEISPWIRILCIAALLISGCDTLLTVGGRTMGVRSGQFIFTDGYLTSSYHFPLEKVVAACEKTLKDMKASGVEKKMKISTAFIAAIIQDESVQINVEYASQMQTLVSIRVGTAGNNMASQLIHEKIAHNLLEAANEGKQ
jgi:hypothetical protein